MSCDRCTNLLSELSSYLRDMAVNLPNVPTDGLRYIVARYEAMSIESPEMTAARFKMNVLDTPPMTVTDIRLPLSIRLRVYFRVKASRLVAHCKLLRAYLTPERITAIQFQIAEMKSPTGAVVDPVVIFVAQSSRGMVAKAVLPVPWMRRNHYGLVLALEGAVNRALVDIRGVRGLANKEPDGNPTDQDSRTT